MNTLIHTSHSRRRFLKSSLAGSAVISLSGAVPNFLLGASGPASSRGKEKILVVVQLSGGNDGLNTVIPFADDEYYKNRFTLAIGKQQVLKIDAHVGLHPGLRGFHKLVESGKMSVVQGVGYPNPNRSHFESMDLWHSAHQMSQHDPTGWLGRSVDINLSDSDLPALHFGRGLQPLALKTDKKPIPSIRSIENFKLGLMKDRQAKKKLAALIKAPRETDNELLSYIHQSADVALSTSHKLENVSKDTGKEFKYPQTELGRNLSVVAGLIASGLSTRIYYTALDGFDTHSNQGDAHRSLLTDLGDSVAAFMKQIKAQGNDERVALLSFSEFGRRVRENASGGTDHGAAAPLFVCGPSLKKGLVGDHPSLTDLDQGDMKFGIDYRTVYADLLENWLEIDSESVVGGKFEPLGLFKGS